MNYSMMKKVIEDSRFSLPLAARLLAVIQPEMVKHGVKVFPVVAVIGKSGCGKTELIRALLEDETCELDFSENTSDVLMVLKENKTKLHLLDDFAQLTTDAGLRKQKATIDAATRQAHKGKSAVLCVTMESIAQKYLAESCANRMLLVDLGQGVEDQEFSDLLSYLQETDDVDQLIHGFTQFMSDKKCAYVHDLKRYREKVRGEREVSQRLIALVFCYRTVMELLDEFLAMAGYDSLDMEKIAAIEESFYEKKMVVGNDARAELAELLLRRLIGSGEIQAQLCPVQDECQVHLNSGCADRGYYCQNGSCRKHSCVEWITSYSPNDLFLDYSCGSNALLIDNPMMIPHFRRPFDVPPFLIIEADLLTAKMNTALAEYCRENGDSIVYFTHETLRKCLRRLNRCVVMPNKKSGYRYTVPHYAVNEGELQDVRVVIVQLRSEELKSLTENGVDKNVRYYGHRYGFSPYCGKLINTIAREWPKLSFVCGPVGELMPEI